MVLPFQIFCRYKPIDVSLRIRNRLRGFAPLVMASRTKLTIRTYSRRNRIYGHQGSTVRRPSSRVSPGNDCPPSLPQPAKNKPSHPERRNTEPQNGLQDDLATMQNSVALIERVCAIFASISSPFELILSTEFEKG